MYNYYFLCIVSLCGPLTSTTTDHQIIYQYCPIPKMGDQVHNGLTSFKTLSLEIWCSQLNVVVIQTHIPFMDVMLH